MWKITKKFTLKVFVHPLKSGLINKRVEMIILTVCTEQGFNEKVYEVLSFDLFQSAVFTVKEFIAT